MRTRTFDREKRLTKRHALDIPATMRLIDAESTAGETAYVNCRLENVSESGIKLFHEEVLDPSSQVELRLETNSPDKIILLQGRVVQCTISLVHPGWFKVRIQLTEVPEPGPEMESWIQHFVAPEAPRKKAFIDRRRKKDAWQIFLVYIMPIFYLCMTVFTAFFCLYWKEKERGQAADTTMAKGFYFLVIPVLLLGIAICMIGAARSRRKTDEKPVPFVVFSILLLSAICIYMILTTF